MQSQEHSGQLAPWWRQAVILVLILGFTVLIVLAITLLLFWRHKSNIEKLLAGSERTIGR